MNRLLLLIILSLTISCYIKSQDYNKFFIGFGYNRIFAQELVTNIELSYHAGAVIQEAKMSGSASGIYIDWFKYYINKKLAVDVSSNLAFFKQKVLNMIDINYEGSAKLYTSSIMLRYNFASKTTQDNSIINTYIGLGPDITKFSRLSATADDMSGTIREVKAEYSNYVFGISSRLGFEYINELQNWSNHWFLISMDIRSCIALGDQKVNHVTEKLNGIMLMSNLNEWDKVNPTNVALCIGICLGF